MQTFDCLDPNLEVRGHHFLEASAGTGKTFAIENVFVRLLKEGFKEEEVLVVTFTNAATRDLVNRIGMKVRFVEAPQIYTIHGFCMRMLSEFALDAERSVEVEDLDYAGIFNDVLRKYGKKPYFSEGQLGAFFKRWNHDYEVMLSKVMPHMGEACALPSFAESCERLGLEWEALDALMWEGKSKVADIEEVRSPENTARRLGSLCQLDDPNKILGVMQECLENEAFVEAVRGRYRGVIVDEFQDTDPVQWEIFSKLFVGHAEAFYLVGDPKQSIYAFRNADLNVYFEAKEQVGGHKCLDTNYRSDPGLIEALNRFFDPFGYPHVKWPEGKEREEFEDGMGPLVFFQGEGSLGRGRTWPTVEMEETLFYPFIAQEVGKFRPSECVVLVKDRFQAKRVKEFLQGVGIPTVSKNHGKLVETGAYQLVKDVERVARDPHNKRAMRRILAHPFLGWDHTRVAGTRVDFGCLREAYLDGGFGKAMRAFLEMELGGIKVQSVLACDLDLYSDFMQVMELGLECDPNTERESAQDLAAVSIMTMHVSKGLEFDVVFALGLVNRTPAQEDEEEKKRILYVALTRAKRRVYVPLARDLSGKKIPVGTRSCMEVYGEVEGDVVLLNEQGFEIQGVEKDVKLVRPKALREVRGGRSMLSFSLLARSHGGSFEEIEHTLPAGAETGTVVHELIERVIREGAYAPYDRGLIEEWIGETSLAEWGREVEQMVFDAFHLELGPVALSAVKPEKLFPEMEFLFPQGRDFVKGFIDLIFEWEDRYYLVDWKTNLLSSYDEEGLKRGMDSGDYFLQAALYREAMLRYLKPFGKEFGGMYYVFLRGKGVYHVG